MGIKCQKYRNPLAPCTGLVGSGLPRSVFKTLVPDRDASFSPIGQQILVLILNILSLLSVRVHTRMYALVHVCVYLCVCVRASTRPCFLAWIWRPCTIVLGTAHIPEPGTLPCLPALQSLSGCSHVITSCQMWHISTVTTSCVPFITITPPCHNAPPALSQVRGGTLPHCTSINLLHEVLCVV